MRVSFSAAVAARGRGQAVWLLLGLLWGCAAPDRARLEPPASGDDAAVGDASVRPDSGPAAGTGGTGVAGGGGQAGSAGAPGPDASVSRGCVPNPDLEDQVCPEICPELCNDRDDDCDRRIDEEEASEDCALAHATSLCDRGRCRLVACDDGFLDCDQQLDTGCEAALGSTAHCGGCFDACVYENALAECFEGACVARGCVADYADCNDSPDSCETATNTLTDCGTCDVPCEGLDHASPSCASGSCGVAQCIGNWGNCNGVGSDGCERELVSNADCGACGSACDFLGSTSSCASGACVATGCDTGYADCDGNAANGCESLNTDLHCGACGAPCSPAALAHVVGAACQSGSCAFSCESGHGDCDASAGNGCETTLDSNVHCGACNSACSIPRALSDCATGSCEFVACQPGWGDCDSDLSNGCETNLNASLTHCGVCGNSCPANKLNCNGGTCSGVICALPATDCDENDGTDCETDLSATASCGACGNACGFGAGVTPHGSLQCAQTNATAGMEDWACDVACDSGYDDCDGDYRNGCETNLRSLGNCGACGAGCAIANATATCQNLTCQVANCNPDWGDCDPNPDTCETPLNTATTCGACGTACNLANALSTCGGSAGARSCQIAQCSEAYYRNCDTLTANGCEVDTRSATLHCNGCGNSCLAQPNVTAASCANSACNITGCQTGFGNCTAAPGCETATTTLQNCGACGNDCAVALPHTAQSSCAGGTTCQVVTCAAGWGDCSAAPGCETNIHAVNDCGGCAGGAGHQVCTGLPHVLSSVCPSGSCAISTCESGWADCDGLVGNGCERDLVGVGPCCNPFFDVDLDGVNDCLDECPTDFAASRRGACGCPSAPQPAGTSCNDGLCEQDTECNGAGRCGDTNDCAPDLSCIFASYAAMGGGGYWFCPTSRPHVEAEATCRSFGGAQLVRIDDAIENEFVRARLGAASWIGANDDAVEDTWRWRLGDAAFWQGTAGGAPVAGRFSFWSGGEPNDLGDEDCAEMLSNGLWNDRDCTLSRPFVCEVPADACPASPKRVPGVCGCALSDVDSDADGTPDCNDGCPYDAGLLSAGSCGCPSSPLAGGTLCADGLCAANAQCDGAGRCGSPLECFADSPSLSAGRDHACAITPAGAVYCWGDNGTGELGDGTTTDRWGPVRVSGLVDAVQVSVGNDFSCALDAGGSVWCWGEDANGRLGTGATDNQSSPGKLALSGIVQIAAGDQHACAVASSGSVWCWGDGGSGRLGNGSSSTQTAPVQVSNLSDAVQVSAGSDFSCALRAGGGVRCWGDGSNYRLGNGSIADQDLPVDVSGLSGALQISAGDSHVCAVLGGGGVQCWGNGGSGRLGDGSSSDNNGPQAVTGLGNAVQVEAGYAHTCAVTDTQELYCWGSGGSGRLGNGSATNQDTPVRVTGLSGVRVSAGYDFTCAEDPAGAFHCWGYALNSRIGDGSQVTTDTPTPVGLGFQRALETDVGDLFSCGLRGDGRVACWGYNANANLGDGTTTQRATPRVVPLADVAQLSVGSDHSCAVTGAGALYCWGRNANGQLGIGNTTVQPAPRKVGFFDALVVREVSGGWAHTCARTDTGKVYCWGYGADGRLGNGSVAQQTSPVAVSGLNDAVALGIGEYHGCAVRVSGQVVCWGYGANGRLGNNSVASQSTPVTVIGISDAVRVESGDHFSCAVRAGGGVKCWGHGANGRLGNDAIADRLTAVDVLGLDDAVQVTTGWGHSCAVRANGHVACWGYNANGRLGDGTTSERRKPVSVLGLGDAVDASAGQHHVCVVRAAGSIVCFGYNGLAQLGDGWTSDSSVPVTVSGITAP